MKKIISTFSIILLAAITFNVIAQEEIKIGEPELTFEKEIHDYGTIEQNANGQCEFTFTNTGTAPLLISKAIGTCGCTIPEWPRQPIQPGATSSIIVKYDTKKIGVINKGVTITTNAIPATKKIRITGNVIASNNTNNSPIKQSSAPVK